MPTGDFILTLETDRSPADVFNAITDVRSWWSGYHDEVITGATDKLGDEFIFSAAGGVHVTRQKLVELIPGERVVWLVTESHLGFLEEPEEWKGTKLRFDIATKDGKTQVTFTHEGLTPDIECYDTCTPSWTQYLQNKLAPMIGAS